MKRKREEFSGVEEGIAILSRREGHTEVERWKSDEEH